MTVRKTVLYTNEKGDKVYVTLSEAENEFLKSLTDEKIRHSTKGTMAYEVLAMYIDPIVDSIDELEQRVDQDLEEAGIEFSETFSTTSELDEDSGERKQRVLWLPSSFTDELDDIEGHLSSILGDALDKYSRSEYDDRKDRIEAKKALLERHGEGETNTTEEDEEDEDSNFRYSFVYDYEEDADSVKQTPAARVEYFQEYLDLIGEDYGYQDPLYPADQEEAKELAEDLFTCSEPSAEKYAERVTIREEKVQEDREQAEKDAFISSDMYQKKVEEAKEDGYTQITSDGEKFQQIQDQLTTEGIYILVTNELGLEKVMGLVHDPESDYLGGTREVYRTLGDRYLLEDPKSEPDWYTNIEDMDQLKRESEALKDADREKQIKALRSALKGDPDNYDKIELSVFLGTNNWTYRMSSDKVDQFVEAVEDLLVEE